MSRLNLALMIAVVLTGLYLVHTAYEARRLFTELDRAQAEARRLESDHQRLQAERLAQATNLRVEQVARDKLHMKLITPAITQDVELKRAASAPQGVQP